MSDDLRAQADRNLSATAERLRLADPRPAYRERLRSLKDNDPEAFARALRHYEEAVLPAIAGGTDVMEEWVKYGAAIAAFTAPGRLMAVDPSGLAARFTPPVAEAALILHVPDDNAVPVLVAAAPAEPTPAQRATLDLLVNGRLAL